MVQRVDNYLLANARKNCKYIFRQFFVSCSLNQEERRFEIRVYKTINVRQEDGSVKIADIEEYVDIEDFKKWWGPQWKIIYHTSEEA